MSNNSSTSESNFQFKNQLENDINKIESEETIDIKKIYQAIVRRRKLFAITTGTVVILTGIFNIYNRIFNPVYKGSFTILIRTWIKKIKLIIMIMKLKWHVHFKLHMEKFVEKI